MKKCPSDAQYKSDFFQIEVHILFIFNVVLRTQNLGSITKKWMNSFRKSISAAWAKAWQDKQFQWRLILAFGVFAIFPWKAADYFQWIQARPGDEWPDFLLAQIPAANVSYPIFGIIYTSVIYLIIRLLPSPHKFLWFAWAFNMETILRFCSIYFVALNPPNGLVDLHDPLAELFIYGDSISITKDLFFSGHTATMVFVCYFLNGKERKISLALTGILVGLLLIQHVHYTWDILAAPVATLSSIWLAKRLINA